MFLLAFLLVAFATGLCLFAVRATLSLLGLSAMQTLLWLGLADVPAPPASRRRRT